MNQKEQSNSQTNANPNISGFLFSHLHSQCIGCFGSQCTRELEWPLVHLEWLALSGNHRPCSRRGFHGSFHLPQGCGLIYRYIFPGTEKAETKKLCIPCRYKLMFSVCAEHVYYSQRQTDVPIDIFVYI